jgi:hypothetical protein
VFILSKLKSNIFFFRIYPPFYSSIFKTFDLIIYCRIPGFCWFSTLFSVDRSTNSKILLFFQRLLIQTMNQIILIFYQNWKDSQNVSPKHSSQSSSPVTWNVIECKVWLYYGRTLLTSKPIQFESCRYRRKSLFEWTSRHLQILLINRQIKDLTFVFCILSHLLELVHWNQFRILLISTQIMKKILMLNIGSELQRFWKITFIKNNIYWWNFEESLWNLIDKAPLHREGRKGKQLIQIIWYKIKTNFESNER